jgi:hypothetical protein
MLVGFYVQDLRDGVTARSLRAKLRRDMRGKLYRRAYLRFIRKAVKELRAHQP